MWVRPDELDVVLRTKNPEEIGLDGCVYALGHVLSRVEAIEAKLEAREGGDDGKS